MEACLDKDTSLVGYLRNGTGMLHVLKHQQLHRRLLLSRCDVLSFAVFSCFPNYLQTGEALQTY